MFGAIQIKRIGIRLALALALSVVVVVVANTGVNMWLSDRMSDDMLEQKLSGLRTALISSIDAEAQRALSMATIVAETSVVKKALAERDRDTLADLFVPQFGMLKAEHGVRQFQFHLAPATSFLRVHKPEKFGDDLSSFRHTVVAVNTKGKQISGLERGVAGLGMRGVVPVHYQGAQVGSVEFGLSFGQAFFDGFSEQSGSPAALYILRDDGVETFATTFPTDFSFDAGELRAAAERERPSVLSRRVVDGSDYAIMLAPVADFEGNTIGVAAVSLDRTPIDASLTTGRTVALAIGIMALLLAMVVAWMMNRSIARPIAGLTDVMLRLAGGDTSVDIPERVRADELGSMAGAVQVFKDNAIEKIRLEAEQREAAQRAETEKRQAMQSLADRFDQVVGGIVDTVGSAAADLQGTARELNAAVEESETETRSAADGAKLASESVQTVASAAEEMSAAIQEVNGRVADAARKLKSTTDGARGAEMQMDELARAVAQIDEVVAQIGAVAEQTNLLALNATIEAARAGDAGKGFAVVASEVKSLATQTQTMTGNISAQLAAVKQASAAAVKATQGIVGDVDEVNETTGIIAAAIEEQTASTTEISRSAQEAAHGTGAVSGNLDNVRHAAQTTAQSSSAVNDAANGLADQAQSLRSAVQAFLQEVRAA